MKLVEYRIENEIIDANIEAIDKEISEANDNIPKFLEIVEEMNNCYNDIFDKTKVVIKDDGELELGSAIIGNERKWKNHIKVEFAYLRIRLVKLSDNCMRQEQLITGTRALYNSQIEQCNDKLTFLPKMIEAEKNSLEQIRLEVIKQISFVQNTVQEASNSFERKLQEEKEL